MAGAETAKMVASLDLKDNLSKGLQTAGKNVDGFSRKLASSRAVAVGVGVGLERVAEKGLSLLGNAIGDGIQGALTLERTMNATQAVIESTGGAAGVSAQQVHDLANSLEDLTGVDDKTVQQGENLLLTFTNIGKTVFPQAAKEAVNMAVAFNKGDAATADIDKAAIQLGKALNDPAAGFTALKKSGVSFSEAQIKILKGTNSLTKEEGKHYLQLKKTDKAGAERYKAGVLANKQLASQKLILAELEKEFGKAGQAAQQGFAGDINRANDAIEEAQIALAQGLIPAVGEVARELSTVLKDPTVLAGLKSFGTDIGKGISGAVAFAKSIPWDKVGQGLSIAAEAAKTVVGAFTSLPPWVQAAVISGWGLNKITGGAVTSVITGLATTIGKSLLQSLGLMTVTAGTVIVNGGVGGPGGLPNVIPEAGAGAAAGAAGIGLGTIAVLAIAPASIAALGIAITNALDPQHIGATTGKAETATARGVPDWNNKALGELIEIRQGIDGLPGKLADDITGGDFFKQLFPGKAQDDATFAQTLRDIPVQLDGNQAAINDNGTKIDAVTQGILGNLVPSVNVGAHNTSLAATQAGQAAARQTFASGLGIEGAIRASQPITNVKVEISATNVTAVNVVSDRGGERNGSRDGDGGGGPGQ
jgi:hypothetical protein